jgi:hypothetical protein
LEKKEENKYNQVNCFKAVYKEISKIAGVE